MNDMSPIQYVFGSIAIALGMFAATWIIPFFVEVM